MLLCPGKQVQTQLELTDREWAVLYFWSEGLELGSRATLIRRDPKFFALVYKVIGLFRVASIVQHQLLQVISTRFVMETSSMSSWIQTSQDTLICTLCCLL